MEFQITQISSLEKVRRTDALTHDEIHKKSVMAGERLSYQICLKTASPLEAVVTLDSPLAEHIKLYLVKDVYMDQPVTEDISQEDYITLKPGMMPDVLVPLAESQNMLQFHENATVWVRVDIPADMQPGTYLITVKFALKDRRVGYTPVGEIYKTMQLEVIPATMPEQKLIYTRWFYADCIAVQHNVEIYSEAHWELIEKYIAAASDLGINMILVPTHTPPLDTAIGTTRPCVQLIDIEKKGDVYEFKFDKFERFINICKRQGIQYFEMAHMFSQWGAKCAANIMVTENGVKDYMFGWHVAADSDEYVDFLKQYITAISSELVREGISEQTYFHISDEPNVLSLDTYKKASEIIRPLLKGSKTLDALSKYEFYEKGLIECPVTSVRRIHEFLEHKIENQWTYYCCGPQTLFTNSFMAMPSYRVRILGFLLYKYDIKGFLHWGFNFYNTRLSLYPINPYTTTSADSAFPSGDPYIVYPGIGTVYSSIRGEVTYDAIQDMRICMALESYIGRAAVIQMIDEAAQRDLRFDDYPRSKDFLENLRAQMLEKIKELA